jgi:hypothetical protein
MTRMTQHDIEDGMKRNGLNIMRRSEAGQRTAMLIAFSVAAIVLFSGTANAQTQSVRDTATAYGARLNAKGEPANLNPNRINNRVAGRLDTRLGLRIERYRPDSAVDPTAAFVIRATDPAKISPKGTLLPPASLGSQSSSASRSDVGSASSLLAVGTVTDTQSRR